MLKNPGHNFNVNDTIAWWLSQVQSPLEESGEDQYLFLQGAPAEKLTVGMPTFGHGWELMDENEVSSQDKIKKTISPEWSVLPDSGEQSERTIHQPIRLPRLLRDHAGPQQ